MVLIDKIKDFLGSKKDGGIMPGNKMWFETEIDKIRYADRIRRVKKIDSYLAREHKVLERPDFQFKGHTYETAKIVLQTLKSIVKFHSSFICGEPVSITGDKEFVSALNKIYRKGDYIEADLKIARDLISYADAFEYVYLDENNKIRSKIIKNTDAYPLYDAEGKYYCFVENWTDSDTRLSYSNVYYPDRVEIYRGRELVDTKENLTGLPIWYSSLDKTKYDNFGDPFLLDLIPIMDSVENLLSKLDDAVTTLSMNPFGVVSGQRIKSEIPKDIVGVTLNLEDGGSFNYANATMDKDSIKLELDYLIQQFYAVACVPSSILGQSNVANVSETSITMLYQQTSNFNRQFITEMTKGFMQRMEYIRKLMEIQGQTVTDEVFDSINFLFNVSKPVDNEANMNNMKIQYDCGAISKQTIIDKSPYTTDTALELQRLQDEAKVSQEIEELTPVPDTKTEEIVIDDENN